MVVAVIMVIYVLLGTAMEELSMILLTVPIFFPLIVHLGLDPIWFGVLIVVVVEIGLISPPVGMNLFVLKTLLPQVPTAHRVPRRAAVHRRRLRAPRDPDRLPGHLALPAEPDEMKTEGTFIDRVSREMDARTCLLLDGPTPELLAACCRILAYEGHESGLAGQVTARGEKPGTWWTLQFGYGFDEATAERMVLVDEDLKPLSGGRPNPGVRFHIWIYNKRPDVQRHSAYTRCRTLRRSHATGTAAEDHSYG